MFPMRSIFLLVVALAAGPGIYAPAQCPPPAQAGPVGEPEPWEGEISQFEAADKINPPPKGAVLFIGGSSIRLWPNIQADFPKVNVVQRGFGGTDLHLVVHYAPRVVLPYCPRLIVVYAGDNDLAEGRTPDDILTDFKAFVRVVRRPMPKTRIAFVAIKPSGDRVALLEKMRTANALVREYIATDSSLTYVDVFTPMLGSNGRAREDLFQTDRLHMNAQGYALWRDLLQPIVSASAR
jgi:lysophospholipase L1-like esterase